MFQRKSMQTKKNDNGADVEFINLCSDENEENPKRISTQDLSMSQREKRVERNVKIDERRQKDYEEEKRRKGKMIKAEVLSGFSEEDDEREEKEKRLERPSSHEWQCEKIVSQGRIAIV